MKKLLLAITVLTSCTVTKHYQEPRFCIVVDEVRYYKNNLALIKPRLKKQKKGPEWWNGPMWYRYPNHNVHVGDTVDVSMSQAVEPRFN